MPADRLTLETSSPAPDEDWSQLHVEFTHPENAERVVAEHLLPLLGGPPTVEAHSGATVQAGGSGWWFLRKWPAWRIRYRPDSHRTEAICSRLDALRSEGTIRAWHEGIYEPEVHAFGGPDAMTIAHRLFHHDSAAILSLPAPTRPGRDASSLWGRRPELAVLTVSLLLRSAGLDWYEQGDTWATIAELRGPARSHGRATPSTVAALMRLDTRSALERASTGGPVRLRQWPCETERAGSALAELNRRGALRRGLRAVLAHHAIFHWNRLGLPFDAQHSLASLASDVVFHDIAAGNLAVQGAALQDAAARPDSLPPPGDGPA